jgi:hypothetical protein
LASKVPKGQVYDIQVGFYEAEDSLMPGAENNIEALRALEGPPVRGRGRVRVRVNTGRDATRSNSPTRYDHISVRNIMAGNSDGSSNTSFEANDPLATGVIGAQAEKLKPSGKLHFAASGRPFFKPGDHRLYPDRVDTDSIAAHAGLARRPQQEYQDGATVKKNHGRRDVGVDGTYTRIYQKPNARLRLRESKQRSSSRSSSASSGKSGSSSRGGYKGGRGGGRDGRGGGGRGGGRGYKGPSGSHNRGRGRGRQ